MSLDAYFAKLIERVEASKRIHNGGKDDEGFYKPTRTIVLRHLNLLKDLHAKSGAKAMVKDAWAQVVKEVPSEWLVLSPTEKAELQKILN